MSIEIRTLRVTVDTRAYTGREATPLENSAVTTAFRFTTKDLEAMPEIEGVRYEIIDGELYVSYAPHAHHQYAADEIRLALRSSPELTAAGFTFTAPGLIFAEDQNVIPDLIWISKDRYTRGLDEAGHFTLAPELVVEVLSPGSSNELRDREIKLSLYSRQGVDEYWIVDWRARRIQVYRRFGAELRLVETLTGDATLTSPLLPGFVCPITNLWVPISGSSI
jgi:Uma2 family endonuclease